MKRLLLLALMLCFALLTGCSNDNGADSPEGANGGIIDSQNDGSADTNRNTGTNDDTLLDRSENAVDDLVDGTENTIDDMADDLDPNRNTTDGVNGDSAADNRTSSTTTDPATNAR